MKLLIKLLCLFTFVIVSLRVFGQAGDNYLYWSASRKLTVADFAIITSDLKAGACYAQYYFSYEVNGFDFMSKNFNKKVHDCILRSAS